MRKSSRGIIKDSVLFVLNCIKIFTVQPFTALSQLKAEAQLIVVSIQMTRNGLKLVIMRPNSRIYNENNKLLKPDDNSATSDQKLPTESSQ